MYLTESEAVYAVHIRDSLVKGFICYLLNSVQFAKVKWKSLWKG